MDEWTPLNDREIVIAEVIARVAHYGQFYQMGPEVQVPYIVHPAAVVAFVSPLFRAAAWLHDVLEDTSITIAHFRAAGITEATIEAVILLTRDRAERYDAYIQHIIDSHNLTALVVKHADLTHNMRPGCPDRLWVRYQVAIGLIKQAIHELERNSDTLSHTLPWRSYKET